ncbi:hypothetical protein, partial [Pseudomonas sp. GW456-L14]|uniref:hypothetical protein n=1 Tax=Pseudomonas sp. GW456-L14 TaxID=2070632 RepID=UPI001C483447
LAALIGTFSPFSGPGHRGKKNQYAISPALPGPNGRILGPWRLAPGGGFHRSAKKYRFKCQG